MSNKVAAEVVSYVDCILRGGWVRLPERHDDGEIRMWDSAGAEFHVNQGMVRLALAKLSISGSSCGWIDARLSVHGYRHRKFVNDMAWLSFLERHPNASRSGWGASPFRAARHSHTEVVHGKEVLTAAGIDALEFYRLPF